MSVPVDRPLDGGAGLLRYRQWRGAFRGPWYAVWAIARVCLLQMFRRKLFWAMYGLSLLIFLFYFFGQYLQVFLEQKITEASLQTGSVFARSVRPEVLVRNLRNTLQLNGSADTYGNFIWFEGYIVVVILALVGSVIIGNDFHHGSLPFYLAKPISKWHYVAGKCLAIGIFVNLMTTIPAILLYIEYGFIDNWDYYLDQFQLLLGILAYGATLTMTLSLLLMATATWLRRTVPMVMLWTTMFVLTRLMQRWLVDGLKFPIEWRLIDIWNNTYLVGMWCMGKPHSELLPRSQPQPSYYLAFLVLLGIWIICILYLRQRIKAVEVVQ